MAWIEGKIKGVDWPQGEKKPGRIHLEDGVTISYFADNPSKNDVEALKAGDSRWFNYATSKDGKYKNLVKGDASVSKFEPAEDEKADKQEKLAAAEGVSISTTPAAPAKAVTMEQALDDSTEIVRASVARTISILRDYEKDIEDLKMDRTRMFCTLVGTVAIRAEKRLTVDTMTRRTR